MRDEAATADIIITIIIFIIYNITYRYLLLLLLLLLASSKVSWLPTLTHHITFQLHQLLHFGDAVDYELVNNISVPSHQLLLY